MRQRNKQSLLGVLVGTTALMAVLWVSPVTAQPATWEQLGLDIDGEAAHDVSGQSVAMSSDGNTVIVGAYRNDGTGSSAGHARVYRYDGASWNQLGLDIDGEAADDWSGYSVAMSSDGNTVIVGAYRNDGTGSSAGHARVYRYDGASWNQLGLDIDGEAADDFSGYSVAMSSDGNTVIIGAYRNDGNGSSAGHARVYRYNGASWSQLGLDIDGEAADDFSGWSVAMSSDGNTVIIGARNNDGNGSNAGQARVYRYDGASWNQLGLDIDGETGSDVSGYSVAMSSDGNTVIIGAPNNGGTGFTAGQARVYRYDGASWNQLGLDIDGEAAHDFSGWSVAMRSDGNTVIIGAYRNDGNGSDAGQARVYRYDGASWNQLGLDIDGEAWGDESGSSVAMSSDGNTVIIGARANDGSGSTAGHARVYRSNADTDGDGIQNDVDGTFTGAFNDDSGVFSDDFTDQHLGGVSFGAINDRNGLDLSIADAVSPSGLQASAFGVGGPATLGACTVGNPNSIRVYSGGTARITCGSLTIETLAGQVEFELTPNAILTIPSGATVTIDDLGNGEFQIDNQTPAGGPTLILDDNGTIIDIEAGASTGYPVVAVPMASRTGQLAIAGGLLTLLTLTLLWSRRSMREI